MTLDVPPPLVVIIAVLLVILLSPRRPASEAHRAEVQHALHAAVKDTTAQMQDAAEAFIDDVRRLFRR